jgi:hypothetical protein
VRTLLVDPSGRGGIVHHTRLVARALRADGARPTLLACRTIGDGDDRIRHWLSKQRWSRPDSVAAWPRVYAGRAARGWSRRPPSRLRLESPDVIHFQAPINRQFDAGALAAHPAPRALGCGPRTTFSPPSRLRRIRTASRPSTVPPTSSSCTGRRPRKEVNRLAGVNPAIVEHVPDDTVRVDRGEARRRLGVPEDERVLGALGVIRASKGYELLADVWSSSATPLRCCWWWVS